MPGCGGRDNVNESFTSHQLHITHIIQNDMSDVQLEQTIGASLESGSKREND